MPSCCERYQIEVHKRGFLRHIDVSQNGACTFSILLNIFVNANFRPGVRYSTKEDIAIVQHYQSAVEKYPCARNNDLVLRAAEVCVCALPYP